MAKPRDGGRIIVFNTESPPAQVNIIQPVREPVINVIGDSSPKIIQVVSAGPPGGKGQRGIAGPTGSTPPFYIIEGTPNYATTSSIALLAPISSSIISTGSQYSLGDNTHPWGSLYLSSSLEFWDDAGNMQGRLTALDSRLYNDRVFIGTGSIGFSNDTLFIEEQDAQSLILITGSIHVESRLGNSPLLIRSGSDTLLEVYDDGTLKLKNFVNLPPPVDGGLIISDGNLYIGG